jgi:hypothetical protein
MNEKTFEEKMEEINKVVEECKTLKEAKSILRLTMILVDQLQNSAADFREFEQTLCSVLDELIITVEHHTRANTPMRKIEKDFKTILSCSNIISPNQLGWNNGQTDEQIGVRYEDIIKRAKGRMNKHFKEYGEGKSRKEHFRWLRGQV